MPLEELKLDRKMFKFLASDTKREILKKLAVRRMTVSELSKSLKIHKSAVFTHLEALVEAGLLHKKDTNNEWVYYELTEKGRTLVSNNKKIIILLASSVLSLVGSFVELYKYLTRRIAPPERPPYIPFEPDKPPPPVTTPPPVQVPKEPPYELIIGVLLIILSLALVYYAIRLWRKYSAEI